MIAIIDYGSGNIKAISNIYTLLNIPFIIVRRPDELKHVSKCILPGVGSFDSAMSQLVQSGMKDALSEHVLNNNMPILGICVGMQILAEHSDEGSEDGLGWIKGCVKKLDIERAQQLMCLPHMGWNQVKAQKSHPLFHEIPVNSEYYFLHSYYFQCESPDDILATTDYAQEFCSMVGHQHIFGVQFHPEKSHHVGIQLLKNFGHYLPC